MQSPLGPLLSLLLGVMPLIAITYLMVFIMRLIAPRPSVALDNSYERKLEHQVRCLAAADLQLKGLDPLEYGFTAEELQSANS